ncbi:predicted protein [Chaetomium globosum CBS 148.51]|uniref:Uncharacterized protein n=1 Tax=Chaetomium globosum (strain ATCC 6205 / CBS 148.51 / DSM 1962 / NBRC 6347 / NRRL 1970) TaxID=306901 RepID=Q2H3M1_CHAGB|nr:uncharacterized protein CHGG_06744 [Chaetomium globosum CBS 148.51]EAQ90125.1 predicted protein [Chaetomium globosum CBS 148.51]
MREDNNDDGDDTSFPTLSNNPTHPYHNNTITITATDLTPTPDGLRNNLREGMSDDGRECGRPRPHALPTPARPPTPPPNPRPGPQAPRPPPGTPSPPPSP